METSVQPVQSGIASANKMGFSSENKLIESAKKQVSLADPKDKFVNKSHEVQTGAITGLLLPPAAYLIDKVFTVVNNKVLHGVPFKDSLGFIKNVVKEVHKTTPTKQKVEITAAFAVLAGINAGIGAGIGAIVKACHKKD